MTEEMQMQMSDGRHNCTIVPAEVFKAIADCMCDELGNSTPRDRETLTNKVAVIMAREGWTFCACYRHENSPAHALVYALVSTVEANFKASGIVAEREKAAQ